MELVVDTNIVIAAIIRPGATRSMLMHPQLDLSSPARLVEEMEKHREEIQLKSWLDDAEFEKAVELVLSSLAIVHRAAYSGYDLKAQEIAPDKDDAPFFALALQKECAIWTNEKRLKKQDKIKIYDTAELCRLLAP
jgi:predicted nucleic acid-binding protein